MISIEKTRDRRESALELECREELFSQFLWRMLGRCGRVQLDGRLEAVEIRGAIGAFCQVSLEFPALGGCELCIKLLADVVQHIGAMDGFLLHAVM